jgi:hypothetical protein
MKYSIFFSLPIVLTPFSAEAVSRNHVPMIEAVGIAFPSENRTQSSHRRQIAASRPQELLRLMDENRLQRQQLTKKIDAHQALIKATDRQIEAAQQRFSVELGNVDQQINLTHSRITSTQITLRSNQQTLETIRSVVEAGAMPRIQLVLREDEVNSQANELEQHKQELTGLISEKENLKVAHRNAETQSQQMINQQTVQILKHLIKIEQLNTDYQRLQHILELSKISAHSQK